jgi:hypothetical protein
MLPLAQVLDFGDQHQVEMHPQISKRVVEETAVIDFVVALI